MSFNTFCSSQAVAERFGRQHSTVLKDICNLDCSENFRKENFQQAQITLNLGNGKTRKTSGFQMTRDGFLYLVMGYSDPEAIKIKLAFIEDFNLMSRICESYPNIRS